MRSWAIRASAAALLGLSAVPAAAQTVAELQRQIDELKSQVQALTAARAASAPAGAPPAAAPVAPPAPAPSFVAAEPLTPAPQPVAATRWYDRLQLRGYTQLRFNRILGDEGSAPAPASRLRSVHDAAIGDDGGFSLRRVRLVLQGDIGDRVALYLQHDFGAAVNNQSSTERRENFGQLRDAYVDLFVDEAKTFRLRFGQSKVPFGWENLQSSSNRLTLDRSDAINSGAPGERDLGVVAYYTPPRVQAIWDRLADDGQKLFGNYGAFGVALYNGQGTNRTERNGSLMQVALATWPFALDALGPAFAGQVLELGGSAYRNRFRPELRSGGVSTADHRDERIGLHAILYPQPFGVQAEWSWGRGPQFDDALAAITTQPASGGYVQLMFDMGDRRWGRMIPYGRWQRYRGGWKASVNAPRLATDELELGVEWQFLDALELTLAYADAKRREPDERRIGRAEGDLLRAQLQWNY